MNKYKKVGLSALCGTLASITGANAGELEVLGTVQATWTSLGGQVTGNPIGMNTGLTFKGSGELDGGQTFSVSLVDTDKAAYSSANITLNTNSLGKFVLSSAEGGQGIGGYDDNMPRAWEEVWDTAIATNVNLQKGVGSSTNLSWTSPEIGFTTLQIAWAPDNDGAQTNNKGVSGSASDVYAEGFDAVLDINPQFDSGGFNLFLGVSQTEIAKDKGAGYKNLSGDHEEAVAGLVLNLGPVEVGAQVSGERLPTQTRATTNYYGNSSWGVAFNINDDLSVSYGESLHIQGKTKKVSASEVEAYTPKSRMHGESWQIAYTIGGIALKYADTKFDDTGYTFDGRTAREARVVAMSMAF